MTLWIVEALFIYSKRSKKGRIRMALMKPLPIPVVMWRRMASKTPQKAHVGREEHHVHKVVFVTVVTAAMMSIELELGLSDLLTVSSPRVRFCVFLPLCRRVICKRVLHTLNRLRRRGDGVDVELRGSPDDRRG